MGAAEVRETEVGDGRIGEGSPERLSVAPDAVEVRRHAGVAAGVGLTSSAVAIAYFARAAQTGSALDWALAVGMALLGSYWLVGLIDARTPLLVADTHGIRLRLGRTWRGLPWTAVHHVQHLPRRGLFRDGRLVVVPHNPELVEAELDRSGRRQTSVSRRLYGSPFAVPLGLATRVIGAGEDLSLALERVADSSNQVVVIEPPADDAAADGAHPADVEDVEDLDGKAALEGHDGVEHGPHALPDPRPRLAHWITRLAQALPARVADRSDRDGSDTDGSHDHLSDADPDADQSEAIAGPVASATPAPLRESTAGRRSEVRRDIEAQDEEVGGRELRRPGSVSLVEETQAWGDRVLPISRGGQSVEPIVLDDFAVEPAEDPVVGPDLAAARTRLGLTIDALAERTRIRPHVIESIEVDDFAPCGGDFYARGHLRTLARILGIDVAPLLASYDERYAHAPINPRRVFETELATGANGSIRSTRGGPNWSILVAVVMALVLCWSIARLVMDTPAELRTDTPVLNGSGGPQGVGSAPLADPVPVVLSAETGGAHLVVRDGAGKIVFKGDVAAGGTRELEAAPPVRVQSSDGAVTVAVGGGEARPVGDPGVAGQGTFVAP